MRFLFAIAVLLLISDVSRAQRSDFEKTDGERAFEMFGEQVGEGLGKALDAAAQGAVAAAKFNSEISVARAQFLAKPNDKRLSRAFADKLRAKDFTYMLLYVLEGTSDYSKKRVGIWTTLAGGELDGGIHPAALGDYFRWIEGLREDLGVRNDKDVPLSMALGETAALEKALANREALYINYVKTRNSIEMEPIEKARIAALIKKDKESEKLPSLFKQKIYYANRALNGSDALHELYMQTYKAGAPQQVLACTYGPLYRRAGEEFDRFQTYTVWYKSPPANYEAWRMADKSDVLLGLGGRAAAENCPQSVRDGELLWRHGRDAHAGNSYEYTYGGPR